MKILHPANTEPSATGTSPLGHPGVQRSAASTQFETLLAIVDVVSFDLFDTLVHRDGLFSPSDLFYQVQELAEQQLGLRLDAFPSMRIHAEERARVQAWGRGLQETTLDEIYGALGRMLNLEIGTIQSLKELELACERSALLVLESGQRLFKAGQV